MSNFSTLKTSKKRKRKMSEQFWREFWWFWTMTTIKSSYKSSHDCSERKQWACAPFNNYDDTQSHRFLHLQKEHQFLFFILRHQIPYFWYYQQVLKKSSQYISDYSALSALVSVLISGHLATELCQMIAEMWFDTRQQFAPILY